MSVDRFAWLSQFKPCNFSIEYNPQATVYDSVQKWFETNDAYQHVDILDGEREKMIATKTIWTMTVYLNTPVGHFSVAAASLEALVEWAMTLDSPRLLKDASD